MQQLKIIVLLMLLVVLQSCSKTRSEAGATKPVAGVTILPYADFVQQIAGESFDTAVLVPPGISPELFDPQPKELSKLKNTAIFFSVGQVFAFESVILEKLKSLNPGIRIVDCSKGITAENQNPHVWLDPGKVKIIIEIIYNELILQLPDGKELFSRNKNSFLAKLDSLDSELNKKFSEYKNRTILTYHPAWGYFTRHYGIKEMAIEKNGKAPSARELAEIIKFARVNKINTIFLEPQFDRDVVESIADQLNLKIIQIDPLPGNYLSNMNYVAGQFIESFK